MTQFKTVALPATELVNIKTNEMYSVATANKALAPIAEAIQNEAKGGWKLHSITTFPATVWRKKGILEKLLGWIPIIGLLFRSNAPDVITPNYYCLVFEKEE